MSNLHIDDRGMFRCCPASLRYQWEEGVLTGMDGTHCEHCGNRLVRNQDGVWRAKDMEDIMRQDASG